jgi:hypothetical protein
MALEMVRKREKLRKILVDIMAKIFFSHFKVLLLCANFLLVLIFLLFFFFFFNPNIIPQLL